MSRLNGPAPPPKTGSKEIILKSALALFAEMGFDGTTTRSIAKRAGVNEVTIFRTFGSKEELFRQVAREMIPLRHLKAGVDFSLEGRVEDVLVQNARMVIGILKENRHVFMILVGDLWRHPELKQEVGFELLEQTVDFLAAQMRIMIDDGRLREIDPYIAARSWMGMVQTHFLLNYLLGTGNMDPYAEDRLLMGWADIFVNGAGRQSPRSSINES